MLFSLGLKYVFLLGNESPKIAKDVNLMLRKSCGKTEKGVSLIPIPSSWLQLVPRKNWIWISISHDRFITGVQNTKFNINTFMTLTEPTMDFFIAVVKPNLAGQQVVCHLWFCCSHTTDSEFIKLGCEINVDFEQLFPPLGVKRCFTGWYISFSTFI